MGRLTIPACPYRGLGAFTADDAAVFVGRENEVGRLREMVRRQPLVVVTGPSGVGKSSLVNAGLIPLLRDEGWAAGSFHPGGMPVHALARALAMVQAPGRPPAVSEVGEWAALIRADGLASLGSQLALTLGQPVLLHVDQLEEILDPAACPQDLKSEFFEVLLSARAALDDGLHLVGTLRADFWTQLLEHPDAGARLADRWFGLSPMSKDRLEKVIAEPASASDVHYQDGLISVIAEDGGGGRGLPLLEFALTQLWPHQQGRRITWAAYQGIGGVTGALSRHAEQSYQDLLGRFPEERIRRVMLALVRSRGGAAEATRRVVSRERLGEHWEVAQALAKQRLLSVGRDPGKGEETAEIAHEALIREWPRFASWVNDDADFQRWLTSAEERAAEGELLPDTRLAEADRWLAERAADVPREVKQLVEDSKSEWLRRVTELENARNLAEEAAREAEARRLAADAELALRSARPALIIALALGAESLLTAPTMQGDLAVRHALRLHARTLALLDHEGSVRAVAFSPDGTRVATGGDGAAQVFDAATGKQLARLDHEEAVRAVAFSPDGTRVATASFDHSTRVFNAATGKQLVRLDHDGPVNAVAFSPDGTRVATASHMYGSPDAARVFDAATGELLARLDHEEAVRAVVFSPDGTRVATASADGAARVFDAATGEQLARLDHDGPVDAVVFSPDGTRVATGSEDGAARVFDAATGEQLARLDHYDTVNGVAFSPDGTRVATASQDGAAGVFAVATGKLLARLDHEGVVNAVVFSPDGTRVATASADGAARVVDAATGKQLVRLDLEEALSAVAFSPDGTRVATGSWGGSARVFDAAAAEPPVRLDHQGSVSTVVFSPDGTRVATGSEDGSARVFDTATGKQLARLDHQGSVLKVVFSPDGTRVATVSGDYSARVFDSATGKQLARLQLRGSLWEVAFSPDGIRVADRRDGAALVFDAATGKQLARLDHDDPVVAVRLSPDGTRVATVSGDHMLRTRGAALVFDVATGKQLARLDREGPVNAVAFSPDGTLVATASADGAVRVFDMATGKLLARLDHDDPVVAIWFSPDGTRVATVSGDYMLRTRGAALVFDVATGKQLARLDREGPVNALAFSPDGTLVATASADGAARVFAVATGEPLARLDHEGVVNDVVFSPDGTLVATASADGAARVFEATYELLVQRTFNVMIRPLNPAELQRYSLHSNCRHVKEWSQRQRNKGDSEQTAGE